MVDFSNDIIYCNNCKQILTFIIEGWMNMNELNDKKRHPNELLKPLSNYFAIMDIKVRQLVLLQNEQVSMK